MIDDCVYGALRDKLVQDTALPAAKGFLGRQNARLQPIGVARFRYE